MSTPSLTHKESSRHSLHLPSLLPILSLLPVKTHCTLTVHNNIHSRLLFSPQNRQHHRLLQAVPTAAFAPQRQQQAVVTSTAATFLHHFRAPHHHNNHLRDLLSLLHPLASFILWAISFLLFDFILFPIKIYKVYEKRVELCMIVIESCNEWELDWWLECTYELGFWNMNEKCWTCIIFIESFCG